MTRRHALGFALCCLVVATSPAAIAAPRDAPGSAALLSRYPAGAMPMDGATMTALRVLGERGGREDISLLRNVAEHERDEIGGLALEAIASIRARQHADLRARFARDLSHDVPRRAPALDGLGASEAACAAYAVRVLGEDPMVDRPVERPPVKGDPADLIAHGRPRLAVKLLAHDRSEAARRLEARAWEDLGDAQAALRQYALLAAQGHTDGWEALAHYGVDPERLLLGLLARDALRLGPEAELLELLVRRGDARTVEVLAERATRDSASERAVATDAIARMVTSSERVLSASATATGHEALQRATRDRVDSIRAIALEALAP